MNPLQTIVEKLQTLDSKILLRYGIAFPLFVTACICGIHLIFTWQIKKAITHIESINVKRTAIEKLLARKSYVDMQRSNIHAILDKDPYFKFKEYCSQVIHNLHLDSKIGKGGLSTPTEQNINNNYLELLMADTMTGLSTKELVTFLIEIESNPRVYLKEIKITTIAERGIDISYVVAALKMQ